MQYLNNSHNFVRVVQVLCFPKSKPSGLPFRISLRNNKDELRFPSEWIFGTFENKQAARNGDVGGDNNGVECDDFSETLRENYLEQAASSKMSQPM